jgi:hypothetical protein
VIARQGNHDALPVAQLEERVEEYAERAVEPDDLVVQLARIGPEPVADRISR